MLNIESLKIDLAKGLHAEISDPCIDLFFSYMLYDNPFNSNSEIDDWIKTINDNQPFKVNKKNISDLDLWSFNNKTGDLEHESGRFFSIRGLNVNTNKCRITSWDQPIIDQQEIGMLGILAKKFDGILYFLMQAKAEPGNINTYQISPTVQATRSNFQMVHKGKATNYLDYFINAKPNDIIIDQLQSEQGARFFSKRNRNMIIITNDNVQVLPGYKFMTIGQIYRLIKRDNVVNMDTRSVLSNIFFTPKRVKSNHPPDLEGFFNKLESVIKVNKSKIELSKKILISSHPNSKSINTSNSIIHKITDIKFDTILKSKIIPLNRVKKWEKTSEKIYHTSGNYFEIIGLNIEAVNREVNSWDQPIIKQVDPGLIGFIYSEIDHVLHFLIQLKTESGVMDLAELSPTVQCITSSFDGAQLPPYTKEILNAKDEEISYDAFHSEEGGRFYKEANRNIIINLKNENIINDSGNYIWMNMYQISEFIKFNNYVNIEARSLLSCIPVMDQVEL